MVVLSAEDGLSAEGQPPKDRNWPKDEFGRSEALFQLWWWVIPVFALAIGLLPMLGNLRAKKKGDVVVYCSQDQIYAERIFHDFEKTTGIAVRAVYDNEAVKTVGLANRLLAERTHPQCDLFWSNEEMRTRQLAAKNVFRETNGWVAFGYRTRRIVINTNQLSSTSAPRSLIELTNEIWRGKVALAYPQFGTTATHFHALRQYWGDEPWQAWCRALSANKPLLVDGNSVVAKVVGKGEAWVGLTDSDDIAEGEREGLSITELPVIGETLLIPNTAAVTRGAPHAEAAQRLFEYLPRREVLERLVAAHALEGSSLAAAPAPTLKVDWSELLNNLESTTVKLNDFFLR